MYYTCYLYGITLVHTTRDNDTGRDGRRVYIRDIIRRFDDRRFNVRRAAVGNKLSRNTFHLRKDNDDNYTGHTEPGHRKHGNYTYTPCTRTQRAYVLKRARVTSVCVCVYLFV